MPPWSQHWYPGRVEAYRPSGPAQEALKKSHVLGPGFWAQGSTLSAHLSCAEVNASVHRHVPHGPACQQSQGEVLWSAETAAEDGTAIWGEEQREVSSPEFRERSKRHGRLTKDALGTRPSLLPPIQLTKRTTRCQGPQKRRPHSHLLVDPWARSRR